MFNFYFHSTPGKRLIDADTGRLVGTFDKDGFLAADDIAAACAGPLIDRIQISHPPYFPVHITVWDGNALPIADASVTVGTETATTDADGCLTLKLLAGVYPITVSAEGYESEQDEISVEKNMLSATYSLTRAEV